MASPASTPAPRLHVALYAPRFPHNTRQIARTCFAMDLRLHLIRPLGLHIHAASLRRAVLGYREEIQPVLHSDAAAFRAAMPDPSRVFLAAQHGRGVYNDVRFRPGDVLVFGNETEGLPPAWLAEHHEQTIRIPMHHAEARCLYLPTAVTVLIFEALRQIGPPSPPQSRV